MMGFGFLEAIGTIFCELRKEVKGSGGYSLVKKVKNVKVQLKAKFSNKFSSLMEEIRAKERRLFQVEVLRETNSDVMLWKEFVSLKQQINCLRRKETLNLIQKSRLQWLRFGDCNSKFFHMPHNSRIRVNTLHSITNKGEVSISYGVFIALVPKKLCPQDLNDFRPISLISSVYKVLSKVLARRIKAIMESVDFEKAYDTIEWIFVDRVLEEMKFGQKWRKWISFCLSSARATVLVNGSPTKFFSIKRGLGQGDPLSPFLFNIVSEDLNVLLSKAVQVGLFTRVDVGRLGRYGNEKEALWRKLIDVKYGRREFSLSPMSPKKSFVSPVWKKITYVVNLQSCSGVVARKGLMHHVARGDCTRFWDDNWIEGHVLKLSFTRMYVLASQKIGLVCDFGYWEGGNWKWEEVENMKYNSNYHLSMIWKFKSPPKARILCWKILLGKLPTRDLPFKVGCIYENQDGWDFKRIRLSWCAPTHGALKFNVDGSAMGKPGLAGIGGLLQNTDGVVLAIFSISVGILDSNVAEVMAIKKAFSIIKEKEESRSVNITIESDSLNAVSWVNHPDERPWRLLHHFYEIDAFLSVTSNRLVTHIKRERNNDADKLAKEGVSRSVLLVVWQMV
nr:reverse transcriptase [Tanacetum cinerariifolium]